MIELNRINKSLPLLLITFIGVIYIYLSFHIEFLGDDLGFYHSYESQSGYWYSLPRFMYRHWIWNNGRMADMLTPLGLNILPLWANAILNGSMTALMFWLILKSIELSNKPSIFIKILIILIVAFTFRWDALWMEFITQYNYVFTAAFGLGILWLLLHGDLSGAGWYRMISIPFCFIAAAMHEAMGIPMAAGVAVWLISSGYWKSLSLTRKIMAIMIIVGGIFPLTSPPAWNRVGMMMQPESIFEMLILSAGWLCLLLIATAIISARNPARLRELIRSPWIMYTSASIISCAFMLISQFGGRTGWFCEIFAVIALAQMIDLKYTFNSKPWLIGAWLLSGVVIFHYIEVAAWQKRLYDESKEIIRLYKNSETGILFYDYHSEQDLPIFLLKKVHAFPDDDDSYYRYRISLHHGKPGYPPVILPTEAYGKIDGVDGLLAFRNRYSKRPGSNPDYIISRNILPGEYGDTIVEKFPRIFTRIDGKEYIRNSFTYNSQPLFIYSLVDRDRGEK